MAMLLELRRPLSLTAQQITNEKITNRSEKNLQIRKKKKNSRAKQSAINHRDVEYTIPRYTETNKKRK